MKCAALMAAVRATDLNDPAKVVWSDPVLLGFLNDALRALIVFRPDASAITEAVKLGAGTRQTIPAGGLRLIGIHRNMGSNGQTPGRVIRLGDLQIQDDISPAWHTEIGATVYEYFYDPLLPHEFFVSPGVPASLAVWIEVSYARTPAEVTDAAATDLPVDASYAPALHEWMVYRAWGGDDDAAPNYAKAQARLANFYALLDRKGGADAAVSAKPVTRR